TIPDSATVGYVVHAVVRILVPHGTAVTFRDSVSWPSELESAGARIMLRDSTPDGVYITVLYPLTAWRPGDHPLPSIPFQVNGSMAQATFEALRIQSVLPPDTTGIEARPLKSVLGGTRVWWPWILGAIAALLLAYIALR